MQKVEIKAQMHYAKLEYICYKKMGGAERKFQALAVNCPLKSTQGWIS
jgi:hypothetical protein